MIAAVLAHAPPARVYVPILAQLKRTHMTVLLPATFGPGVFATPGVLALATASTHEYKITIAYDARCEGQNVCAEGSISGSVLPRDLAAARAVLRAKPDADDRGAMLAGLEMLNRPTPLIGGVTGYYSEWLSGADDGGNSRLTWFAFGAVYTLETRIGTRAGLARIANSALQSVVRALDRTTMRSDHNEAAASTSGP